MNKKKASSEHEQSEIIMSKITDIFDRLENITREDGQAEFVAVVTQVNKNNTTDNATYTLLRAFLSKILTAIDELASEMLNNDTILISVKNQKILRTCFQLITSVGISNCLIPGLGISLAKRCSTSNILPKMTFNDDEKYDLLVDCTNFFTRSYKVPVIKNIIVTLHMSDYLAALIQLSFAPLKKPGTYNKYVMTPERYKKLNEDRKHFVVAYTLLANNCFQPALIKELLVLQGVNDPSPPAFAKRVIVKELSRILLAPGGLLSLIRCFIESYCIDTGYDWENIDILCRLVSQANHGIPECDYLMNISTQLSQILTSNNTHYLTPAVACLVSLNAKYPDSKPIQTIIKDMFQAFDQNSLECKSSLPGTVILSPLEVNHKVNILHACVCSAKLEWPIGLLSPNLYVLFLIGSRCSKHEEFKIKLKDILLKCLERLDRNEVTEFITKVLFNKGILSSTSIAIEEYDSGVAIKSVLICSTEDQNSENEEYFLELLNSGTDNNFTKTVFEALLDLLIELSIQRKNRTSIDLLTIEDKPLIEDFVTHYVNYTTILNILSEIACSPKVVAALKNDPIVIMKFIQHFLLKEDPESNVEITSLALILLNLVLENSRSAQKDFLELIPILKRLSKNEATGILCKQVLSLFAIEEAKQPESACDKAIANVFDNLLPVRAHGLMELTKLIDAKDPETVAKKSYIFCLFQEQLRDPDSYIYLSAVNGLAALCTHYTDDVLHLLCTEFLQSPPPQQIEANADKTASETRMKIGDVIVKVTRRLGEMAVVHKTELLNTMLSACRDDDPLIRTSALSNLAEIALVMNYKLGNIIYELLRCLWDVIETDKAIECRRAAVMVISSLLKGLGKETLFQLKENLLPIYRTLKMLYSSESEDSILRLHAQIALEELNDIAKQILFPELDLKLEKRIIL